MNMFRLISGALLFTVGAGAQVAHAQTFQNFVPGIKIPDSITQILKQKTRETGVLIDSGDRITVQNGPDIPTPTPVLRTAPSDVRGPVARSMPSKEMGQSSEITSFKPGELPGDRVSEVFDPRVIGGQPASIEDFPWQAMLIGGDVDDPIRSGFCGGSLIATDWIITAAHCLAGLKDPSQVDVVVGSSYPRFSGQGDRVKVLKMIIHPDYQATNFDNDIALLHLQRPVKRGIPIKLASPSLVIPENALGFVTGWGAVTAYGSMIDKLLVANVPVVATKSCNSSEAYSGSVTDHQLCAGYRDGGVDACQGDSGGPLMARVNSTPTLIGIVSWGKGCAMRLKYGVYTRVTDFSQWVSQIVGARVLATR